MVFYVFMFFFFPLQVNSSDVTVLVHLAQCGTTESDTCLTSVKIIVSTYPVSTSNYQKVYGQLLYVFLSSAY